MNANSNSAFSKENKDSILKLVKRKSLYLTGVSEVVSFDESMIALKTLDGELTIEGEGLHINKLNLDIGEVDVVGLVSTLVYSDGKAEKGRGVFTMFKR